MHLVKNKKTTISVAIILILIIVCSIVIPIVCVNKWCFTFDLNISTQMITIKYIGTTNTSYCVSIFSPINSWQHIKPMWSPSNEDNTISFPADELPDNGHIALFQYANHGIMTHPAIVYVYRRGDKLQVTWS